MPAGSRLTVRLSPALEDALSDRVSQGARVSDIVREALEAYLGVCPTPRPTSRQTPDVALADILSDMADIRARLAQLEAASATRISQRRRPTRRPTPRLTPSLEETPQAFDTTKYRLGKLCPRGHDWQSTGQSLRVHNKAGYCLACNAHLARAKRQASQPPP